MATSMRAGAQNLVHLEVVSFPDPTTPSADRFQYCLHRCGLGTRLLLRVFTYSPAEWMAALRCVRIREQLKTVKKKKISSESDDQTIKVWQRRNSPNWALQVLLYFSEGFPNFFYIFRESHTTPYNDKQK